MMRCPLCLATSASRFDTVHAKVYWRCPACLLIFLQPEYRLDPEAERARYELHENRPDDIRYRQFLSRLADPLIPKLPPGAEGLDYGSGPGPTLSVMLEAQGFRMQLYDPFFAPDTAVLKRTYDFITCTETVEHFYAPHDEFTRFNCLLHGGGWLGIMTEMLETDDQFHDWWYHRDETHVCFYRAETMGWIGRAFGWEAEFPRKNVVLFQKGHRR